MSTVFLHIGAMKSGSSFLQSACEENRRTLAKVGIRYVSTGRSWRAVHDLRWAPTQGEADAWRKLARQVRRSTTDTLISNELLCQIPEQTIHRVASSLAPHELRVILTVRDITRVVPSHWQERIQNGSLIGWTEFCETVCAEPETTSASQRFWRHYDAAQLVSTWSNVLSHDHITVVTVPTSGKNPELLWERFLTAMGVSDIATKPATRANPSLGAVSAELLLKVNAELTDFPRHDRSVSLKGPLAKRTLAPRAPVEPRYALTREHHAVLRARAADLADGLRSAGVRVIGNLDEIVPPENPMAGVEPGGITDSELLEAAVSGLAGMARQLARRHAMLTDLKRERARLLAERRKLLRQQQGRVERQRGRGQRTLRSLRKGAARLSGRRINEHY